MNNRAIDYRGEKAMGLFLDKYFYPDNRRLDKNSSDTASFQDRIWIRAERVYDYDNQVIGSDIWLFTHDGIRIEMDEKTYLSRMGFSDDKLGTFAFELCASNKNNEAELGWFLKSGEKNVSKKYLLVWINEVRDRIKKIENGKKVVQRNRVVAEDFLRVTTRLIDKDKLKEHLFLTYNTNEKELFELSRILRTDESILPRIEENFHKEKITNLYLPLEKEGNAHLVEEYIDNREMLIQSIQPHSLYDSRNPKPYISYSLPKENGTDIVSMTERPVNVIVPISVLDKVCTEGYYEVIPDSSRSLGGWREKKINR